MINDLFLKIHHKSTPWYEKAKLINDFHVQMIKENGHKDHKADLGWSLKETADALGISKGFVHRAILCHKLVLENPKIKSKYESISEFYEDIRGIEK